MDGATMPQGEFDGATTQYLRLLESLGQAVIVTTVEGIVTAWGGAATSLYGWSPQEVLGRSIVDVTPSAVSRVDAEAIMRTITSGHIWSGRFGVRAHDGRTFEVDVTDVPLLDPEGRVSGVIGISAPPSGPVDLVRLAGDVATAAERIWPGRITLSAALRRALIAGSAPHALQLLSLLLFRFTDALNTSSVRLRMQLLPGADAPTAAFFAQGADDSVYLSIDADDDAHRSSVLRDARDAAQPTYYARALVRVLGGTLLAGRGGQPRGALHLILPVMKEP